MLDKKNFKRIFIYENVTLTTFLSLMFFSLLIFFSYEHSSLLEREEAKLLTQSKIIKDNLIREIESIKFSQINIKKELYEAIETGDDAMLYVRKRMEGFKEAIHTVRSMTLTDKNGLVIYSTQASIIGSNLAYRDYFKTIKANPNNTMLYVSKPFTTTTGIWTINISTMITDSDGNFNGVITSSLDPKRIEDLLSSVFYSADMWSAVTHRSGVLFLSTIKNSNEIGKDIDQNGSFFIGTQDLIITIQYTLEKHLVIIKEY